MMKFKSGNTLRLNTYFLHDEQPFSSNSSTTYFLPSRDTIRYYETLASRMQVNHLQAALTINNNTEKNISTKLF